MSGFRENLNVALEAFADVPEAVKVLKLGEEFGEASEAYIGARGLNPRKGITHTTGDVADELCDVAITALVAMSAFTVDPIQRLTNRMEHIARRHEASVSSSKVTGAAGGLKCDNHDRPDCPICLRWAAEASA